jgi:hypothetical protein
VDIASASVSNLHLSNLLLACCVLAPPSAAVAVPIAPGATEFLSGIQAVDDPRLRARLRANVRRPFEITDTNGDVVLRGQLQDTVARSILTEKFIFGLRLRDLSRPSGSRFGIARMETSGFADFSTDVEYRTDSLGVVGPNSATRSASGMALTLIRISRRWKPKRSSP